MNSQKLKIFFCWLLSTLAVHVQAQEYHPDSGCFVYADGTIENAELHQFRLLLQEHKDSVLYAIRSQAFELLAEYAQEDDYTYNDHNVYLRTGKLFDRYRHHAVLIFLSDAFLDGTHDYYLDVHLFEVKPNGIVQIQQFKKISGYYREIGAGVHDMDKNGSNELIVATSQPEWAFNKGKPANEYYHLFLYDIAAGAFTTVEGFEQLPNPVFLNPRFLYTYQTCGCGGDCWLSELHERVLQSTRNYGILEDRCTGIGKMYETKTGEKKLVAETIIITERTAIPDFWRTFLNSQNRQ